MALDPEVAAHREQLFEQHWRSPTVETRNALVESYVPLAEYFAGKYERKGVAREDLNQVANLALVNAIDRFDPDRGVRFSTFAGRTINGELKKYFRDKTWSVRVPRPLKERALLVRRVSDELMTELGKPPTPQQISETAGLELEEVLEALDVRENSRPVSLDQPQKGGGADAPTPGGVEVPQTEPGFARADTRLTVQQLLSSMSEDEREILRLRFEKQKSQAEIAELIGVSQMQVSRLLRGALSRLRDSYEEDG